MAKKREVLTSMGILLLIVLAISVSLTGCSQNQQTPSESDELTAEEAKTKTVDYLNNDLLPYLNVPNPNATAISAQDKGSVYEVVTKFQGQEAPVYLSKDGEMLLLQALNISDQSGSQQELSADEAKTKAINYLNENLQMSGNISAVSVEEKGLLYEVLTEYQGQQRPVYVTVDGRYLFLAAFNTSEELPEMTMTPTPAPTETATPPPYSNEELQQFVNCLNKSGMKIYGAKWCPHCQDLVNMLGGYDVVDPIYVECPENQQLCQEKGIEYYPTVMINGSKFEGSRTYQAFSQATGCPVPQQ